MALQVVICGDFFQLPPVWKKKTPIPYAFLANAWAAADFQSFHLHQIHRQNDPKLMAILKDIRLGLCTRSQWAELDNTKYHDWQDGMEPVHL